MVAILSRTGNRGSHPFPYKPTLHFRGSRCPGKVLVGPDRPAANTLARFQETISLLDKPSRVLPRAVQNQNRMRRLAMGTFNGNDRTISDSTDLVKNGFDVIRINVETVRSDDDLLLPAPVDQVSVRIDFTDVARVKPTLRIGSRADPGTAFDVFLNHAWAAHPDLAIFCDGNFLIAQTSANGATSRTKRVVCRDDRTGFGQSVSLDYQQTHSGPELLDTDLERGTAHDEAPKLPAELPVYPSIVPPPPQDATRLGPSEACFRVPSFDVGLKAFQNMGNGDKD